MFHPILSKRSHHDLLEPVCIILKYGSEEKGSSLYKCSILLGFLFVKKPKRFVILSSDKSSDRNLSSFFDIKKTQEDRAFTE